MRILLLGATGRIGGRVLRIALAQGHDVVALTRDPSRLEGFDDRLTAVAGSIGDADVVAAAMHSVEAVVAAVGPSGNTRDQVDLLANGMRNTVTAMTNAQVARIVTLSGAAVDVPGDHKPFLDRAMSGVARRFARHVVGAKQAEYGVLAGSPLAWTALRPPLVTDGRARGYVLNTDLRPGARVTRDDVAQALVDQITDLTFVRQAPFVLPP